MTIAFLVQDLAGKDGWSRYARDLSKALAEKGHAIHAFVHQQTDAPWCEQHVCLRPPLTSMTFFGALAQWWSVRGALRKLQPDVVHVVCEPYAIPLAWISGPWKRVLTIHGSYAVLPFRAGGFVRRAMIKFFGKADGIIAVSNFTKNYVKQSEPALFADLKLDTKITVVQNGVQLSEIPSSPAAGTSHPENKIIGVGAVKNRKGYIQAVRALALLKRHSVTFQYDIVGSLDDRGYVSALRAEIDRLGLTREVRLLGTISEKALDDAYATADAFLLLSLHEGPYVEGFGLVFLEAAARGIPCVGPTTGGCPEAVRDGKTGFVRDPENADAVAAALEKILRDNVIDSSACIEWAKEHDIKLKARDIEKLYQ